MTSSTTGLFHSPLNFAKILTMESNIMKYCIHTTQISFLQPDHRILILLLLLLISASACTLALEYPDAVKPADAVAHINNGVGTLENNLLELKFETNQNKLRFIHFIDKQTKNRITAKCDDFFSVTLANGKNLASSQMKLETNISVHKIPAVPQSARLAERFSAKQISAEFVSPDDNTKFEWLLILRDKSNYIRQFLTIKSTTEKTTVKSIMFGPFECSGAETIGSVTGSPITADNIFCAYEHPSANNHVDKAVSESGKGNKRIICELKSNTSLANNFTQSFVIGIAPPGQMRRGFLYYLETERIRPYRPFLHYNSWYDIAWPERDKMNETECINVIENFGKELITKRGVKMHSFVFDDGWDDPKTLWQILKSNFPNGFTPLTQTAKKYDSRIGAWLSPWGGYGKAKQDRLDYGKTQGFETNKAGFSLAGPHYYQRFRQSCIDFMDCYNANFFKFDGTDAANIDQVQALFQLTNDLYEKDPGLFISLTVGTWASPFWLLNGDSIWRNGHDMSFFGKGSKRQQWLTYRDMETYHNVVVKGPLYPLNSLMNQGIVHAKWGPAKLAPDPDEFAQEVYSFFGIGTNLQELYMSYDLMTPEMWDILATGAKWSQQNSDILVDTHWIGGDPHKLEIYGCASWQSCKGIIMLRNPDDKTASISLNISEVFELPPNAPRKYSLKPAFEKDLIKTPSYLTADSTQTFTLNPFQVIVLEAYPVP